MTCLVRDRRKLKALDPEGLQLVQGDVTRPDTLEFSGHDAVIHCAGVISYQARERAWQREVNVGGTGNVLDAAARAGCSRLVLTSSIAALGWVEGDGVGDEETAFNWQGLGLGYQETKKEAEDLALSEQRLECVAVNPGIVFGSHDINRSAGRMLLAVQAGGPPGVPSGRTTAVNLRDVVSGHLAALDRGRSGERYILGGFRGSFLELFSLIATVLGQPAPTRVVPGWLTATVGRLQVLKARLTDSKPELTPALAKVSCRNRQYSWAKSEKELGFSPGPLSEGIERCMLWYREQGLVE